MGHAAEQQLFGIWNDSLGTRLPNSNPTHSPDQIGFRLTEAMLVTAPGKHDFFITGESCASIACRFPPRAATTIRNKELTQHPCIVTTGQG